MTHKQHAVALTGQWSPAGLSIGARVRQLIFNLGKMFQIPVGYQDETGFHYGAEPAQDRFQWPASILN
jgi:hypothetical protein